MRSTMKRWKCLVLAGVLILGFIVALNLRFVEFAIAAASSESRPQLLADASWNSPESARHFGQRFPAGAPESDLLAWLRTNDFGISQQDKRAERRVAGLACNEIIDVAWTVNSRGLLRSADATIREAGCL